MTILFSSVILFLYLLFISEEYEYATKHLALGYGVVLGFILLFAPSPQQKHDDNEVYKSDISNKSVMKEIDEEEEEEVEEEEEDRGRGGKPIQLNLGRHSVLVTPHESMTPTNSQSKCPMKLD